MKAIFATTQDYLLGLKGTMPWALTEEYKEIGKLDMDYFREITKEAKVVMGYKTWQSIGEKPLKGRKEHYIITSHRGLTHEDERVKFISYDNFVKKYEYSDDIICIGGGMLYKSLMPYFSEIYWNELHLNDEHYKKLLEENKDTRVYLDRKLVHLMNNPQKYGMQEKATVLMFDKLGNTITYHRYTKKATP